MCCNRQNQRETSLSLWLLVQSVPCPVLHPNSGSQLAQLRPSTYYLFFTSFACPFFCHLRGSFQPTLPSWATSPTSSTSLTTLELTFRFYCGPDSVSTCVFCRSSLLHYVHKWPPLKSVSFLEFLISGNDTTFSKQLKPKMESHLLPLPL